MIGGLKMGRLFKKGFERDEHGVSGAITAMMIILIISSFISMIYAVYIPMWTKDLEAEHSKLVLSQFLDMKEKIDDEIINQAQNQGVSITTRITLGRSGGPIFGMGTTSGSLTINPYLDVLTLINSNSPDETYAQGRGNITYKSRDTYFQRQTYIYQYGAVIVAQEKGYVGKTMTYDAIMKVEPHFKAEKDTLGNVTITMVQVAFFSNSNTQSVSGTQDVNIQTTLQGVDSNDLTRDDYPTLRNLTLNVTSDYPDVWYKFFNDRLNTNVSHMKAGAGPAGDYTVTKTGRLVAVKLWHVTAIYMDVAIVAVEIG
jgi:hypothetical protein